LSLKIFLAFLYFDIAGGLLGILEVILVVLLYPKCSHGPWVLLGGVTITKPKLILSSVQWVYKLISV